MTELIRETLQDHMEEQDCLRALRYERLALAMPNRKDAAGSSTIFSVSLRGAEPPELLGRVNQHQSAGFD